MDFIKTVIRKLELALSLLLVVSCRNYMPDEELFRDEPQTGYVEVVGNYECVDLGLPSGLKWATCNMGANKPEEYGDYYAWGELETKDNYSVSNSVTYNKYMADILGNPQYDVARAKRGARWRMPTMEEQYELYNYCEWEWTTLNGVDGYMLTSKKNGGSIFLPAAGERSGEDFYDVGTRGYYWSSSPVDETYYASCLHFWSTYYGWFEKGRDKGFCIRPVCE